MDKVSELSRGMQVMLVCAVLLLIDLFLDWQSVDTVIGTFGRSGWHGFWGVVLGLLTIGVIVWLVVRIVQKDLVASVPEGTLALALGVLILIFAVLKNLIDDYSAWPAYVGVVLAAGIAVGGWMIAQERGGAGEAMAWRPSMASASGAPASSSTPQPPAATTPPPPAAEPPPPAAEPPAAEPPPPPDEPQ